MTPSIIRLMHLASQALPIGGYSYSSGLESAIEQRLVCDSLELQHWMEGVLYGTLRSYEIPLLARIHSGWRSRDGSLLQSCNEEYLATRDSAEVRAATLQMGSSLRSLLPRIACLDAALIQLLAGFDEVSLPLAWGAAADAWQLCAADASAAYLWSWAENQVLVAVKSIPLGQSSGQEVLSRIGALLAQAPAAELPRSNFAPGLAILCSQHESQYSRLFRS
jgi:urease accessory protein